MTGRKASVAACVAVAGVLVSGSIAAQVSKGQELAVDYGRVDRVDAVKVGADGQPTGLATGAVVGGLAGSYNSSHGHQARDAAAGALVGALLTSAVKQQKNAHNGAFQYTVKLLGGNTVAVVVEQGDIAVGDCVAVEQGSSANVRRVSDTYCDNAGHPALSAPEVTAKAQEDAADCHVAKQAALSAKTEQEMDVALKKVRVFCEG